jgi:hypothetical protein
VGVSLGRRDIMMPKPDVSFYGCSKCLNRAVRGLFEATAPWFLFQLFHKKNPLRQIAAAIYLSNRVYTNAK